MKTMLGLLTVGNLWAATLLAGVVVWGLIPLPIWKRNAANSGGHWTLDALLIICGPVAMVVQSAYPTAGDPTGTILNLGQLVTFLGVAVSLLALGSALKHPRSGGGSLIVAVVIYYVALLASAVGGTVPAVSRLLWLTPLLVLPFVVHGGYTVEWLTARARVALRTIVALSFVAALVRPDLAFNYDETRSVFGITRLAGIAGHPNTLGILACVLVLLELRSGRRIWLVFGLLALILAQSATAWMALLVALPVMSGRNSKVYRALAGLATLGIAALALGDRRLISGFLPNNPDTLNGRTTIWRATIHGFDSNRMLGYGPTLLDEEFRARYLGHFDAAAQAHNQFFQSLGETGLVGVTALLFLLIMLVVYALRGKWASGGLSLALVLVLLARCITETPLRPVGVSGGLLLLLITLGVVASAAGLERETGTRAPSTGILGTLALKEHLGGTTIT